jgi:hypothetical protein
VDAVEHVVDAAPLHLDLHAVGQQPVARHLLDLWVGFRVYWVYWVFEVLKGFIGFEGFYRFKKP